MSKGTKWFVILAAIGFFAIPATFFSVIFSEPYAIAKQFAMTNTQISSVIGTVSRVRLGISEFHINYGGEKGDAEFSLVLDGAETEGLLEIRLERKLTNWTIRSAALSSRGKRILLSVGINYENKIKGAYSSNLRMT